ncbi:hypothetical protein ACHAW6_000658 [Cyclotella cf. meneghiniana]
MESILMKLQVIARAFKAKSEIGIDCCVGAIDGILIWIHKPSALDIKSIGFSAKKFYCRRKKKFGIIFKQFAMHKEDSWMLKLSFLDPPLITSHLKAKIEVQGFLCPGSCLFGDNAYINSPYMCVPFQSVRINIECVFEILVHHFGILQKAIPMNITVQKTTSLVLALCKLNNFYIDCSEDCNLYSLSA